MNYAIGFAVFAALALFFPACSSAPKRPAEIVTSRNMAVNQLNLAHQTAVRGYYEDALLILDEARRLALVTDDPALRVKTATSRGNFLFSLGRREEAIELWESAAREGDDSGERALAALTRIYVIRARLTLLANEDSGAAAEAAAEELRTQLRREMEAVKSDELSTASGYVTLGMAEKQLRRWPEAERAITEALEIHEDGLCLEDAAYDWFLIASVRSMAGNYDSALEALGVSISYDRRAENGFGIASGWQAMGEVYRRAGRPEEARAARARAAEIFRAMGHTDRADSLAEAASLSEPASR